MGCGWCCLDNQCDVSQRLYGYAPRCPALVWDPGPGRYLCRLAGDPERGAEFRADLGVGLGCCAPLNAWRGQVRERG